MTAQPATTTTTLDVPVELQIKILAGLIRQRWTGERTARELGVSRDLVQLVVATYGRIPSRLQIALEHLEDQADNDAVPVDEPAPAAAPHPPLHVPDEATEQPAGDDPDHQALVRALARGMESTSKRIRNRAEKLRADLVDLVGRIEADKEAESRRRRIAALEAQREQLAEQIAELRAADTPPTRTAAPSEGRPTGKWAAYWNGDGFACPDPDCDFVTGRSSGMGLHVKANPEHLTHGEAAL